MLICVAENVVCTGMASNKYCINVYIYIYILIYTHYISVSLIFVFTDAGKFSFDPFLYYNLSYLPISFYFINIAGRDLFLCTTHVQKFVDLWTVHFKTQPEAEACHCYSFEKNFYPHSSKKWTFHNSYLQNLALHHKLRH